ncbi:MAG: nascent polypeptide-associated complex subunit alpha [Patescibacteria group bacterium]|jgi:nascent polypeptide-associated complex subunit alpha
MIPGMGGVNPKQMAGMMKKMGISQEQIRARRVIFETDEGNLVIEQPDIMRIKMQGQVSYQITGEAILEETGPSYDDDDIEMVMTQTEKSREDVVAALDSSDGDIAEAIVELKGE